jgi:hypothetical protein
LQQLHDIRSMSRAEVTVLAWNNKTRAAPWVMGGSGKHLEASPRAYAPSCSPRPGGGARGAFRGGARQGGIFSVPWGARWTPPRSQVPSNAICHQKSTSNSAGSSVGSLAPPRATPRLGGVYVSCQYFPCSFVLALRELGLRLGVKAPLPLRASSRGVLPAGVGALAGYRTREHQPRGGLHGSWRGAGVGL